MNDYQPTNGTPLKFGIASMRRATLGKEGKREYRLECTAISLALFEGTERLGITRIEILSTTKKKICESSDIH